MANTWIIAVEPEIAALIEHGRAVDALDELRERRSDFRRIPRGRVAVRYDDRAVEPLRQGVLLRHRAGGVLGADADAHQFGAAGVGEVPAQLDGDGIVFGDRALGTGPVDVAVSGDGSVLWVRRVLVRNHYSHLSLSLLLAKARRPHPSIPRRAECAPVACGLNRLTLPTPVSDDDSPKQDLRIGVRRNENAQMLATIHRRPREFRDQGHRKGERMPTALRRSREDARFAPLTRAENGYDEGDL